MPLEEVARFNVSYLQVLDETGAVDERLDPKLDDKAMYRLYEGMVRAREADQRMLRLQRQGRMGTFPPSTGQEAAVCGAALAMAENDWFVGSYRELGGRLMRGDSLLNVYRYWNGYEEGNLTPVERRVPPIQAVIGAHPLHAVGIGYAMKYRGEDAAVVTFFGDGATSQGEVHEAFNFAGVWKAPVVFFCVNNQWAISLHREQQTASQTIAQKALAYGFEGIQVDGNDVLAVYKATRAALERARGGGGPTLIEALSYRLMMHTTADDPRRYRENEEVDKWWRRDPIPRTRKYMEQRGMWNEDLEGGLQAKIKREIDEAVQQLEATEIKPDAPFDHVFATPHYTVERQRELFLARLSRREETKQTEAARG